MFQNEESAREELQMYRVTYVHSHFVTWFTWGFFLNAYLYAVLCTFLLVSHFCSSQAAKYILINCACLVGMLAIAWYIVGIVWRFSRAGRFAANGDGQIIEVLTIERYADVPSQHDLMQYESGKAIFIFYALSYCAFCAILLSCTLLCCIENCPCYRQKQKKSSSQK